MDVGCMPHRFAYCKSPSGQWVVPPRGSVSGVMRVSFFLSLVSVLIRSPLGLRVSSRTSSSQQSPALWLLLAPSATPRYFPMSDARHVYFVDSFIARGSQLHALTKSLVSHLSRSHLQWLANCSHSNGGRPSPSLSLILFAHRVTS